MTGNRRLKRILRVITQRVDDGIPLVITHQDLEPFHRSPRTFTALLRFLVNESIPHQAQSHCYQAGLLLVSGYLKAIRSSPREIALAQEAITHIVFTFQSTVHVMQDMWQLLQKIHFPISIEIKEARSQLMGWHWGADSVDDAIISLLSSVEKNQEASVFTLAEFLLQQTQMVLPAQVRQLLLGLLDSTSERVREVALLFLFSPNKPLRFELLDLLLHTLSVDRIPASALRRLIQTRTWYSTEERSAIDQVIKQAQMSQLSLVSDVDRLPIHRVWSTGFDGGGSQALMVVLKERRHFSLVGILLNLETGIDECWILNSQSKAAIKERMEEFSMQLPMKTLRPSYLDEILPHFIYLTYQQGRAVPLSFLQFAQLVSETPWTAYPLDYGDLLSDQMGDKSIDSLLREKRHLLSVAVNRFTQQPYLATWRPSPEQLKHFYDRQSGLTCHSKLVEHLIHEVFEPDRQIWQQRLVCMALWASFLTRHQRYLSESFWLLATAIEHGLPLRELPLFKAIGHGVIKQGLTDDR